MSRRNGIGRQWHLAWRHLAWLVRARRRRWMRIPSVERVVRLRLLLFRMMVLRGHVRLGRGARATIRDWGE